MSDVLGHRFINSQLVADEFAAQGYMVVAPDLFRGDAVPEELPDGFPPFEDWLKGPPGHLPANVDPIVGAILSEMRQNLGCKKIGGAGCEHNTLCYPPTSDVQKTSCPGIRRCRVWADVVGYTDCFGAKYVVRYLQPGAGKLDAGYIVHPTMVEEGELELIQGPLCIDAAGKFSDSGGVPWKKK